MSKLVGTGSSLISIYRTLPKQQHSNGNSNALSIQAMCILMPIHYHSSDAVCSQQGVKQTANTVAGPSRKIKVSSFAACLQQKPKKVQLLISVQEPNANAITNKMTV